MRRALAFSLMLFALSAGAAYAQYTGTIQGSVTDPAGALVVGAEIAVVNTATGETRNAITNAEGAYVVTALPPGTYDVHIKQAGFSEFVA